MKVQIQRHSILSSSRGGVLLSLSVMVSTLLLMTTASFVVFDDNIERSSKIGSASKTLIIAQGMKDQIVLAAEKQVQLKENSTGDEIREAIIDDIAQKVPAGYTIDSVTVSEPINIPLKAIPVGPFRGMVAPQKEMEITYQIKRDGSLWTDGDGTKISLTLNLDKISPLQFAQFWDLPSAEIYWNGGSILRGPIHSNGDLCMNSSWGGPLHIEQRMTASGRAMNGVDPRCRLRNGTMWDNHTVLRLPSSATLPWTRGQGTTGGGQTNGCTNCNGINQPWLTYSQWHLDSQIIDSALRTRSAKLHESKLSVTQNGLFGTAGDATAEQTTNQGTMRFLVDPPLASDPAEVKEIKFATKADLRIIDGVWYLKDPDMEVAWPGIPIWSDHPGRKKDKWNLDVGQLDLSDRWSWTSVPRRFSPYRYDSGVSRIVPSATGTLFYGQANYNSSVAQVIPTIGTDRCSGAQSPSVYCADPRNPGTNANASFGGCGMANPTTPLTCLWNGAAATNIPPEAIYLLSTRQGFRDPSLSSGPFSPTPSRDRILPANLSLRRLSDAITDTTPGELGSYFGATNFMERNFNGIVYISMSWPGSDSGFASPAIVADLTPPIQGGNIDATQVSVGTPSEQRAIPYQLCTDDPNFIGRPYDQDSVGSTPVHRFYIPSCSTYGRAAGKNGAYINAIRIVEGQDLSAFASTGLSIVSNIPVYLDSGINTVGWVPTLIAGDQVTYMTGYASSRDNWNNNGYAGDPGPQYWNVAIMGGWNLDPGNPSSSTEMPGRIDNWAEWRNNIANITGSLVIGWHPVYYRSGRSSHGTAPSGMRHDPRFNDPNQRPPGMPEIWYANVKQWQRF